MITTPEHEQFRRTVRDFAEKEIAPFAATWDREAAGVVLRR